MSDIFSKDLIEKYKNYMLAKRGFYISSTIAQEDLERLSTLFTLFGKETSRNEWGIFGEPAPCKGRGENIERGVQAEMMTWFY